MGFASNIGKYRLGRIIGEGTFAKVKLGFNELDGQCVAIKIIDKKMVMQSHLKHQAILLHFILINPFRSVN